MRYDRGTRVLLRKDLKPGTPVWATTFGLDPADWIAVEVEDLEDYDNWAIVYSPDNPHLKWGMPSWKLRARDPKKNGRDKPFEDPDKDFLKPHKKLTRLGILSNGDIIGGQK